MTERVLRTLAIEDFRSIRGRVVVPLEAPVILLHGTNGAGKSTVMSALELALTGGVTGFDPVDPWHLVHRGASQARIDLVTPERSVGFEVDGAGLAGESLLQGADAQYFSERCYLQQRTLGRLLELYEDHRETDDSALTAFVNELLGLDEVNALIAGLHSVLDKRRIKRLVADYASSEKEQNECADQIGEVGFELEQAEEAVSEAREALSRLMKELDAPPALLGDPDSASNWLEDLAAREEKALLDLLTVRRELAALERSATMLQDQAGSGDLAPLERAAAVAHKAAEQWRELHGAQLEAVLNKLRELLPGVEAATGARDPGSVRAVALEQVDAELRRHDELLESDELARQETERLEKAIAEAKRRVDGIQQQLDQSAPPTASEELASALAALTPHLHSDDCPVCGRDYSEVGTQPLSAHLASRVSELSAHAERLHELLRAGRQARSDLSRAQHDNEAAVRRRLEPEAKVAAQSARAILADAQLRLVELAPGVADGAALMRSQIEAERELAVARGRNASAVELRIALEAQAVALGQPAPASATSIPEALDALSKHVANRVEVFEQRIANRTRASEAIDEIKEALTERAELEQTLAELESQRLRLDVAIAELDRRRKIMRVLRDEAEQARTRTVQRVFTNSLNRAWRDLFIRLAPEEPFVPAFRVPDAGDRVVAVLETVHRDGSPGGPPAAMLSAGNLNTAALTLFLALNLSVKARIPWILLDDPVQSMDEVHVAQFAALLRTLTREHGRRVLIAVHERALFEYLTLELSPATAEEGLQTIELTRGPDGATKSEPNFQGYVEDHALELT